MLNDRQASELISQSLHDSSVLSDDVRQHLGQSPESKSFAHLSQAIQESLSDIAAKSLVGDSSLGPGLSAAAKSRLRDSVAQAKRESTIWSGASPSAIASEKVAAAFTEYGSGERVFASVIDDSEFRKTQTRFTLLRKIGQGGLGTVWLARDESLKRTVAIKEMNPDAATSPKLWRRFQREAQITGHLEHPGVVPLYLFGYNAETAQPFYAMRFLGKQTLADAIVEYHELRKSGQPANLHFYRLLNAFQDVCQAIAYAHSRGVIHRDLKPENVALDNFGQVIVLDWGLAKITHDSELSLKMSLGEVAGGSSAIHTVDGEAVGTPLYMAPEQAAGELDLIDERTDVYGLGAILFAILTGTAPHKSSSTGAEGSLPIRELLRIIAQGNTPRPSDYHAEVPHELEAICVRAMARERFARHGTATELATDVECWIAGENAKRPKYEALRLEGNEIRSKLAACIRDMNVNARFMSSLPPIQGMIDVSREISQETAAVWRERLTTIFSGMMRANSDISSIAYRWLQNDESNELVRVERHLSDTSNVRPIPKSRLAIGPASEFEQQVLSLKPDEVHIELIEMTNDEATQAEGRFWLQAGVPVFDEQTEEPFGLVVVETCFCRFISRQLERANRVGDILVARMDGDLLFDPWRSGHSHVNQLLPNWPKIVEAVRNRGEFVDSDWQTFAVKLELMPAGNSLAIMLVSED